MTDFGAAAIAMNLIREHGTLRTPALAEKLGIGEAAVDAMLEPLSKRGELTTCAVQIGERRVIEYRSAASGGRYAPLFFRAAYRPKPPQHIAPAAPQEHTATAANHEETDMKKTLLERLSAIFEKHGPMTTAQLREHGIKDANASTIIGQLASRGKLGKLGGGKRSTIYGLPDQKAPATTDDSPRATRRQKTAKRAGGGPLQRGVNAPCSACAPRSAPRLPRTAPSCASAPSTASSSSTSRARASCSTSHASSSLRSSPRW